MDYRPEKKSTAEKTVPLYVAYRYNYTEKNSVTMIKKVMEKSHYITGYTKREDAENVAKQMAIGGTNYFVAIIEVRIAQETMDTLKEKNGMIDISGIDRTNLINSDTKILNLPIHACYNIGEERFKQIKAITKSKNSESIDSMTYAQALKLADEITKAEQPQEKKLSRWSFSRNNNKQHQSSRYTKRHEREEREEQEEQEEKREAPLNLADFEDGMSIIEAKVSDHKNVTDLIQTIADIANNRAYWLKVNNGKIPDKVEKISRYLKEREAEAGINQQQGHIENKTKDAVKSYQGVKDIVNQANTHRAARWLNKGKARLNRAPQTQAFYRAIKDTDPEKLKQIQSDASQFKQTAQNTSATSSRTATQLSTSLENGMMYMRNGYQG